MTDNSVPMPTLTIAILSSQCLVWLGLLKILETSAVPMIVHRYPGRTSDLLRSENRPDLFILDLGTEHDVPGTIHQIRESVPTGKIVLLCGLEDQARMREAFAVGVDGIILKVQPPEVVLAVIEALYAAVKPQAPVEREDAMKLSLGLDWTKQTGPAPPPPAWPDALTAREREIIRLVEQGLSNKDIAYELSISDSTVRHHMTSIFDKVGVSNRQKLLLHAHRSRPSTV
ncbi:MAG: response regulator transcription factor [Nitrospira sp. LK70]|nr:response regulator transcription factor [Nitrospira sp. LK70]